MNADANRPQPRPRRFTRKYIWRLLRFFLLALVVVVLGVMVWMANAQVGIYLQPAPSTVTIPPDLPFTPEVITFTGGPDAQTQAPVTLAGWFVPPQNGATVLLLHGYGGNRTQMRRQAEWLYRAGYGLLLYDERASGESTGSVRSYGWQDVADVGGALAFLRGRADVDMTRIGLLGCSIGGMISIRAAAQYPEIRATIADGPAVVASGDLPPPASWAEWLSVIPNWIIDRMLEARLGQAEPPLVSEVISQIEPRPLLLIA
ncbi:MAG TPA: alpha/beta fold hydrolase, partial [Phototrophicaceae bacterium]|nr:alpha/beta fold hydrolase [Phototrophicaceae bacterium]